MIPMQSRGAWIAASLAGLALVLALSWVTLRAGPAQAQPVMTAPACQCSAPTAIPGLATQVVHCLCGGMACVLSQHSEPGASRNLMQCVK